MQHKFIRIGSLALDKGDLVKFVTNLENIRDLSNEELKDIYDCQIKFADESIDGEPETQ